MNNNVLFLVTIVIVFSLYFIIRYFLVKKLQSNDKKLNNNLKLMINIISFMVMFGLIVFLFVGWIGRFQNGNHNYFNLILLIILTIVCVVRFYNKFKHNKI